MNNKKILLKMYNLIGENNLIRNIEKSIQFTDEPKFFQFTSFINNSSNKTSISYKKEESYGTGLDLDEDLAKIKTIGECIERYCLSIYSKKDFIYESPDKLKNRIPNLLNFINFTNKKEDYLLSISDKKIYWTKAKDIINKKQVLIPAQMIYVPYYSHEPQIRLPISNGAACSNSKEEAIYKGICELIERDSFMIYFLNKMTPIKIDPDSIKNKNIKEILSRLKRYFLNVHILYLSTDIPIPSILCIIIDKSGIGPAVSLGAKTDIDINKAIIGALYEAQHGRTWIRCSMISRKINSKKDIKSLEDRGVYWSNKNKIKDINFMINSNNLVNINNLRINTKNKLNYLLKILKNKKYDVFLKDLTLYKIKKEGFYVTKVIIPQLHPLYLFEDFKYLYSERMEEIPKILGFKSKLNKDIHPFV